MSSKLFYSGPAALNLGAKLAFALLALLSIAVLVPVAVSEHVVQSAVGLNAFIIRFLFASFFLTCSLVSIGQLGVTVFRVLALRLTFLGITILTLLYAGLMGEFDIVFTTAVWSALFGLVSVIAAALGTTKTP